MQWAWFSSKGSVRIEPPRIASVRETAGSRRHTTKGIDGDRSNKPPQRAFASQNEKLAGYWLTTGSATATEIATGASFEWLVVDMEHSANDLVEVVDHLRAAARGSGEPIVRVPWNEPVAVKRLLDCGARSLLFPFVESAREARAATVATRYPPKGIRGYSAINRATGCGRDKDYSAKYEEEILVVVQLETKSAIKAASEIVQVEEIDGVFIGPGDLAASIGRIGLGWTSVEMRQLGLEGLAAIKSAGKAAGTLVYSETIAKELFGLGFDFIAVGSDAATFARDTDRLVAAYKR